MHLEESIGIILTMYDQLQLNAAAISRAAVNGLSLLNSYISDGFNMAAIGNSRMRSHISQTLSCTL